MATKVLVPLLGEGVEEVTVTKWLKKEGDSVNELEPLLEVNTDKVDTEIPAPTSGTVLKILAVTLALVFAPNGALVCLGKCDVQPSSRSCHPSTVTSIFATSCAPHPEGSAVTTEATKKPVQAVAAVSSIPAITPFAAISLRQSAITLLSTVTGRSCNPTLRI